MSMRCPVARFCKILTYPTLLRNSQERLGPKKPSVIPLVLRPWLTLPESLGDVGRGHLQHLGASHEVPAASETPRTSVAGLVGRASKDLVAPARALPE